MFKYLVFQFSFIIKTGHLAFKITFSVIELIKNRIIFERPLLPIMIKSPFSFSAYYNYQTKEQPNISILF